jgi:hypothetical protein
MARPLPTPTARDGQEAPVLAPPPTWGRLVAFLAAAFAVAACEGPSGPVETVRDLERARDLWEARGPDSYVFTYELNCFCGGPGAPPARITVADGQVTGAFLPSRDEQVPEDELAAYPTVPDLFDDVEEWLARDPVSARTEFDPGLGHPVDVFVDFEERVADEELGFRTRDLVPSERLDDD